MELIRLVGLSKDTANPHQLSTMGGVLTAAHPREGLGSECIHPAPVCLDPLTVATPFSQSVHPSSCTRPREREEGLCLVMRFSHNLPSVIFFPIKRKKSKNRCLFLCFLLSFLFPEPMVTDYSNSLTGGQDKMEKGRLGRNCFTVSYLEKYYPTVKGCFWHYQVLVI